MKSATFCQSERKFRMIIYQHVRMYMRINKDNGLETKRVTSSKLAFSISNTASFSVTPESIVLVGRVWYSSQNSENMIMYRQFCCLMPPTYV